MTEGLKSVEAKFLALSQTHPDSRASYRIKLKLPSEGLVQKSHPSCLPLPCPAVATPIPVH